MFDEQDYRQGPLDFSDAHLERSCPYCGEVLDTNEVANFLKPQSNTFVCPNCRKKLNIHELGSGL